ncbi:MAG TPA: riboflavin synthase [Allosphingosinicella sp.]|jgi:riboflavin synthase
MFTGIITDIGRIAAAEEQGDLRLRIACGYDMGSVDLGASIACSGVCLTVVDKSEDWFAVDVSRETIARSAPDHWAEGARLNLERSLRLGDELGGHIVTGHVDGVGEIVSAEPEGDSTRIVIAAPEALAPYIAEKGSIAIDGASLTVNEVDSARFAINIIPHTAAQTTLGALTPGGRVNIEIDILARYIGRMLELRR